MENNPSVWFKYNLQLPDKTQRLFEIHLHPETLLNMRPQPVTVPDWCELGNYQCRHCPLSAHEDAYCPAALALLPLERAIGNFDTDFPINATAWSLERSFAVTTTLYQALGSIVGLLLATCACPHMAFFRPMARFHLPFSSEEETLFRVFSIYFLSLHFTDNMTADRDILFDPLRKIYRNVRLVNIALADRLRHAMNTQGAFYALVHLDSFATAVPETLMTSLEQLRLAFPQASLASL